MIRTESWRRGNRPPFLLKKKKKNLEFGYPLTLKPTRGYKSCPIAIAEDFLMIFHTQGWGRERKIRIFMEAKIYS